MNQDNNISKIVTCSNACYFECGHIVHVKGDKIVKIEGNKDNPLGYGYIWIDFLKWVEFLQDT